MLLWHCKPIVLKGKNVPFNGFADVENRGLATFALRDATWKAGTFGHPKAVFPGIDDYLSHG